MKTFSFVVLLFQLLLTSSILSADDSMLMDEFKSAAEKLITNSNKEKARAIEQLAKVDDERVLITLKALLGARLYYVKSDKMLVLADKVEKKFQIAGLYSADQIGLVNKKAIKKIRINNKLRRVLRSNIAVLELSSSDQYLRLQSAKNLAKNPSANMRDVLVDALKKEQSIAVIDAMKLALALIDVDGDNQIQRMNAAVVLSAALEPEAIAALSRLSSRNEAGDFNEPNTELAEFALKSLSDVNAKLSFYKVVENFIFGLSLGSVLLLAAIGLAITFGVMGVINMAHGEMIMLGAYTTYAIQQLFPSLIDISLFIAIPAAFLVSGLVGVLIERLVIRHLYGRPLDTLLATFGVSLILQQAVRMYNSNNVAVISPEWISGFWQMNGAVAITYNRIYILVFSLLVLGLLALVLKKTLMGLQMRAVTQNRAMANSMGIRSSWVDALTFGLGSGIAGIAGVALSQLTNVGPNLGQGYIIDSFMVVVFGGVGNLLGTFFGAMSLGIANKFLEPYAGAVIAKILVLVFIILFIQWRPRGLFALKGRFVED